MKGQIVRPLQYAGAAALIMIAVLVLALAWMNWTSSSRLEKISQAVDHMQDLQKIGLTMTQLLADDYTGVSFISREMISRVASDIRALVNPALNLHAETPSLLAHVLEELDAPRVLPRISIARALSSFRLATYGETSAESSLLNGLMADAEAEGRLIVTVMIALAVISLGAFWWSRSRIFAPIENLRNLLGRVAEGEIVPVGTKGIDDSLMPLFNNYNQMAARLIEFEGQHRRRASALENEVRAATAAILEQQRTLARAERMAVLGELAAMVAHELRNPLAGIHVALANLKMEMPEKELQERVGIVIGEIERMARMLNNLLAQSRHEPEPARVVEVAEVIKDVMRLVRYQSGTHIELKDDVSSQLSAKVPPDGLRQAVLNLALNAVQSLGKEQGEVVVRARESDGVLRIEVRDSGQGFPDEIIRKGVRAFSTGREMGTGLGLSLVKRFANDLGGDLLLKNTLPRGALAELVLPRPRANV